MSKTLTTKEAMQALLDGKKLFHRNWSYIKYIKLNESGSLVDNNGSIYSLTTLGYCELCEEPKPKKQVWQWRYKEIDESIWQLSNDLLSEELAKKRYELALRCLYEKHAGPFEVEE